MLLRSSIFDIGFISPSLSHKTKQRIFHFSLGHILALKKKKISAYVRAQQEGY
jgi:hypothetical protein